MSEGVVVLVEVGLSRRLSPETLRSLFLVLVLALVLSPLEESIETVESDREGGTVVVVDGGAEKGRPATEGVVVRMVTRGGG